MANRGVVVGVLTKEAQLKRAIRAELRSLGFTQRDGELVPPKISSKEAIRQTHSLQRKLLLERNATFIRDNSESLQQYFANGEDVDPSKTRLELQRVRAGTMEARLFRYAGYTWSVPVSNGFGRRIRYLVWDRSNSKLAGIIALGDPVYNSSVRETELGWRPDIKKQNLVNVLDAYVLGAVAPYNQLLFGKVIACLVRTTQVANDFQLTYGDTEGLISKSRKYARLLAVTTSSSMGRSSVYNRLTVNGQQYFRSIGYTKGWGHFHFSDDLFVQMRTHLRDIGHEYADNNRFGNGPNWKLRTIRSALESLGFDSKILRHGIRRESFLCTLADNAHELLQSEGCASAQADFSSLKTVAETSEECIQRWVLPRAKKNSGYVSFRSDQILDSLSLIAPITDAQRRETKGGV